MALLPHPHSPEFPNALKTAREERRMSRAGLAARANIHAVMPRRYEDPNCNEFTRPTMNTYLALNRALGLIEDEGVETMPPVQQEQPIEQGVLLHKASIEEIVAELHKRHITATMRFNRPA
jgi:transcriptional regulator with XRE-family HTH domain